MFTLSQKIIQSSAEGIISPFGELFPDAIAKFAIELYKTGSSYIGDYQVKACKELLNSTWMRKNYNTPITAAVWMICGALADSSYDIFEGLPDDDSGTRTSRLVEWLKKTNQYYDSPEVHTGHVWSRLIGKSFIDYALKLKPDSYTDVLIAIKSNMMLKAKSISRIPAWLYVGGHWVILNKPILIVDAKVHLDIWTWGDNFKLVISKDDFNKGFDEYHGSIVAYSSTPKRNKPGMFRSLLGPHKII